MMKKKTLAIKIKLILARVLRAMKGMKRIQFLIEN
jgi:hypothetical protein